METTTYVRARTDVLTISESSVGAPWPLDPDITFLNHGSYGVCPRPVLEAQSRARAQMEKDPVAWFMRDQEGLLDASREALAGLIGCDSKDIGWTPNATVAIATVLRNMDWREGDEVVMCDQEYMSAINEVERLGERKGVRLIKPQIRIPVESEDEIVDRIISHVNGRTRLAIISHITSPSAIVMPVERLTRELRARGVDVLIDGAHAPGQVAFNLTEINPTYYVATLHKWVCAPKGAGMIWVHPDRQGAVRPVALSSRAHEPRDDRTQYLRDFDYHGTDDHTPHIAVKDAIGFMSSLLPGGWSELYARNHALAVEARDLICDALGLEKPVAESMIPMMATIQLPEIPGSLAGKPTVFGDPLQDRLVHEHKIQVPVWTNALTGQRFCRISAQVYNRIEQYEHLARTLEAELARGAGMNAALGSPRRIAVVGVSGSGKSTLSRVLARRLELCHVKIDRVFWRADRPGRREFRDLVREEIDGSDWVADGNYLSLQELIWSKAELVIWLDPPRTTLVWRLVRRRMRRGKRPSATGRWHGSWWAFLFSHRSVVPTVMRAVSRSRRRYRELPGSQRCELVRVRTRKDLMGLVGELTGREFATWPPKGKRRVATAAV